MEIAEFLLGAGADIHARSLGQTPLHIAAGKGHVELAQLFLDHGADVNAAAKRRSIHDAAGGGGKAKHEKMEALLKERGAHS